MSDVRFTKDHEWVRLEGDTATIGISEYAQEQLGDVVFIELPTVGADVEAGGDAAVVESVKAASEVYSPVSGRIIEVNDDLEATPGLVNESAEDEGWFWRMELSDPDELEELMTAKDYKAFLEGLD
ncbi:MAG: glycine cleavage system protein GcvH [Proteobacteria bacterium]|nr:glycine cleavage system protein GcvH [Pseudomonadota bacterium]MDA1059659.1 glycine cleavage system protein GcvH [Pseudomonadota bacterium]